MSGRHRHEPGFLKDKGYLAMGGQIIDATIVSAPKQHNLGEENETIKEGETPEDWKSKPAKNRQKDNDAWFLCLAPRSNNRQEARYCRSACTCGCLCWI
jgi:hypothetical protein